MYTNSRHYSFPAVTIISLTVYTWYISYTMLWNFKPLLYASLRTETTTDHCSYMYKCNSGLISIWCSDHNTFILWTSCGLSHLFRNCIATLDIIVVSLVWSTQCLVQVQAQANLLIFEPPELL